MTQETIQRQGKHPRIRRGWESCGCTSMTVTTPSWEFWSSHQIRTCPRKAKRDFVLLWNLLRFCECWGKEAIRRWPGCKKVAVAEADLRRQSYCTITTKCSRYVTRYTYCSLGNMFTTWSYTLLNRKMFTSSRSSLTGQSGRWPTLLLGLCASEFRRNRKGPPRYLLVLMRLPSRAYSHFISPMSAHSLRELLCLPFWTRSWIRRLSLFPKGRSFQIVCRLIRRFFEG